MIVLKLNEINYFYSQKSGAKMPPIFDPNDQDQAFRFILNDNGISKEITIDHSELTIYYGGHLGFVYQDKKYLIDEKFLKARCIKAGYIVLEDYDKRTISDSNIGEKIRTRLLSNLKKVLSHRYLVSDNGDCLLVKIPEETVTDPLYQQYEYTVLVQSVTKLRKMNTWRKQNNLPFYPYSKDIDKYGSMYITIWAKRKPNSVNETQFEYQYCWSEEFVGQLLLDLLKYTDDYDFHWHNMPLTSKIYYEEGI